MNKKKTKLKLRKTRVSKLTNLNLIIGGTVTDGTHETDVLVGDTESSYSGVSLTTVDNSNRRN